MANFATQVEMRAAAIIMLLAQIVFIIITAILGRYDHTADAKEDHLFDSKTLLFYPKFQDVNVMIFIGFGFLMTFLKRYGFSSFGFNMIMAAFLIQWATVLHGVGEIISDKIPYFAVNIEKMFAAEFAAATILIAFGAILGKTNLFQLLIMALMGVVFQHINEKVIFNHIQAVDIGGSLVIHAFGAYYGLAISRVLHIPDAEESKKEGSVYHSDIFSFIGTAFLWVYWPSFNAGLATEGDEPRAVINTYYSLVACTVATFFTSMVVNKNAKLDAVHIQNATLAGGVAVGSSADLMLQPYGAMLIGFVAGVLSTLGYKYLTPFMSSHWKIHDTCGVNNLHGIPGILGGLAGAAASGVAFSTNYGNSLHRLFPARAPLNGTNIEARSAGGQAGFQLLAIVCTIGIALLSGAFTGLVMNFACYKGPSGDALFDDEENWDIPGEGFPESAQEENGFARGGVVASPM